MGGSAVSIAEAIGCAANNLVEGTYDVDLNVSAPIEKETKLFGEALSCRPLCI